MTARQCESCASSHELPSPRLAVFGYGYANKTYRKAGRKVGPLQPRRVLECNAPRGDVLWPRDERRPGRGR